MKIFVYLKNINNMEYNRPCAWCKEIFYASRIDQIFCSTQHRNAFNNYRYKLKLSPYKKNMDSVRHQDEILYALWEPNNEILIDEKTFKKLKIDLKCARQITYGPGNEIVKLEYVKFALELTKNKLYKIIKI